MRYPKTVITESLIEVQGTIKLGFDRHIADVEVAIWADGALVSFIQVF